jgi:D-glycero-alpha-D-manno-heptose-7-phosphate kinase
VPEHCYSGKICGAGGGGYFMFFKKENNNLNLKEYFDVKIDRSGSVIIYNN